MGHILTHLLNGPFQAHKRILLLFMVVWCLKIKEVNEVGVASEFVKVFVYKKRGHLCLQ